MTAVDQKLAFKVVLEIVLSELLRSQLICLMIKYIMIWLKPIENMQRVKETMLQSIYKKEEALQEMVFTNKFSDLILKVWALSLCQQWASALVAQCI